eukprot:m.41652 g.41652  ORF g.41652 m.41652 type:complete len:80 (+) comp5683_c0_seq1:89-328(+)
MASVDDYDALVKVVVVGDKSVGKSSLVLRFCDDSFPTQYIATIGVDFRIRTLVIDGKKVKVSPACPCFVHTVLLCSRLP